MRSRKKSSLSILEDEVISPSLPMDVSLAPLFQVHVHGGNSSLCISMVSHGSVLSSPDAGMRVAAHVVSGNRFRPLPGCLLLLQTTT